MKRKRPAGSARRLIFDVVAREMRVVLDD